VVDDLLSSPTVLGVIVGAAVIYGIAVSLKAGYRPVATAFAAAGALILLLYVQLDGLTARTDLLKAANSQREQALATMRTADALLQGGDESNVDVSIDLLQVSQMADAVAMQAVVAEAQTRVAHSVALLTTLLVLVTLYSGWQTRSTASVIQEQLAAAAQRSAEAEVVLVVPRRLAGLRRWVRPTSRLVEERKL
jgi:hypothetical protein